MENIEQQKEVIVTVMFSRDSRKTLICLAQVSFRQLRGAASVSPYLFCPRELVFSISLNGLLHSVTYGVASK